MSISARAAISGYLKQTFCQTWQIKYASCKDGTVQIINCLSLREESLDTHPPSLTLANPFGSGEENRK